jgi:hypothetical protein
MEAAGDAEIWRPTSGTALYFQDTDSKPCGIGGFGRTQGARHGLRPAHTHRLVDANRN